MEELIFNKSPAPTIGVELELQILDADTLELTSLAPELLQMVPPSLKERIKSEFIQSMVEINTGVCATVAEVERDLKSTFSFLNELTESMGRTLFAVSLHPFSMGNAQKVSDDLRYKRIMDDLQLVGRRFITQGLHVHIGIDNEEKVIKVNNNLRIYLPLLLALSTSSPFYESVDTGLMSYRSKLFEALPLAGMPDSLRDWNEFNNLIQLLRMGGIIQSVKDIWWDVRPHPDFGTIEIRICDLPYSLRDILAITALIQSLVLTLAEEPERPEPHSQILRSNKWQAARYGLEGVFVDPFFAQRHSMKEAVMNLYHMVKPVSEMLKSTEYLAEVPEILKRTTGAHIQKELYYGNGKNFQAMIKSVQRMFIS